jgi:hypothetical protein
MTSPNLWPASSMRWRNWKARCAVLGPALLMVAFALPERGMAQTDRAADKLEELNVRVRTTHYALAGTVSDKTLQQYGDALEFIYREYAAGFSEVLGEEPATKAPAETPKKKPAGRRASRKEAKNSEVPADPPPKADDAQKEGQDDDAERFRVLVFSTDEEYQRFGKEFLSGSTEHTGGMFVPKLKAILICDRGNPDDTRSVLFHEAFHQFVHRYIKAPPTWLNEGLATYYGTAEITRGGLRFGDPPADYWKLVRKLISKNEAIPLRDVVQADRAEFYDASPVHLSGYKRLTRRTLYYAEAYTLIHTLLDDSTGRERLRDYIRDLAKSDAKGASKISEQYFGPDVCEHMTPYWIKRVESRPENR